MKATFKQDLEYRRFNQWLEKTLSKKSRQAVKSSVTLFDQVPPYSHIFKTRKRGLAVTGTLFILSSLIAASLSKLYSIVQWSIINAVSLFFVALSFAFLVAAVRFYGKESNFYKAAFYSYLAVYLFVGFLNNEFFGLSWMVYVAQIVFVTAMHFGITMLLNVWNKIGAP